MTRCRKPTITSKNSAANEKIDGFRQSEVKHEYFGHTARLDYVLALQLDQ